MQLKLDFTLNGYEERREFAEKYIAENSARLTPDNLEMISNYLLWGLQTDTGEDFQIENKGPWKKREEKNVSWEGLQEEAKEKGISAESQMTEVGLKVSRKKLERAAVISKLEGRKGSWKDWWSQAQEIAKKEMPESFIEGIETNGPESDGFADRTLSKVEEMLRASDVETLVNVAHPMARTWLDLWREIDETEFMVQSWELSHGKRRPDLPIRAELIIRLACNYIRQGTFESFHEYLSMLKIVAEDWDARKFNKKKRQLVSLRTEQYPLLDFIQGEPIQMRTNPGHYYYQPDYGILGLFPFMERKLMFEEIKEEYFEPEFNAYLVKELRKLDAIENDPKFNRSQYIDFRNPDIVRQLLLNYHQIKSDAVDTDIETNEMITLMLDYLDYYIRECHFSDELMLILEMKMKGETNKKIIDALMLKHSIKYQENYISTIFTKRIIGIIAEQAQKHYKMIEYILMGKNVFKRCSVCKKLLPRNTDYFNKRTSTSDGFFSYCKECKRDRK